ncbi:hypothetical protein QUF58_07275 [Anaerolineales bacterium HSG24]|nr:hypothetical protein [Anaerolineales bacterium HSG24]
MCDHLRSAPASPVIPWIQGEARRIGVLISNQRYTALPSPYNCETRNLFNYLIPENGGFINED